MLSDTQKIIVVVCAPVAGFSLLIALAAIYKRRTNRLSASPSANSTKADEAQQEIPAQDASHGHIPGLGPSVALPSYEEKVLHVRRLSAYPEMDEIRRVSSVTSTLGPVVAEQQERERRGSGASTLVVTDMGEGRVGVERRPSVPDVDIVSRLRSGSTSSTAPASTKKDPGSPRDKRFSMHLSYIIPPSHPSPVEPDQPMETLTTPLPPPVSATPLPPLASPRSPRKQKDRPDSIDLAIARSTTIVTVIDRNHAVPPLPPTGMKAESPHTEPGQIFKGWEGFSSSPPTPSQGLGVSVDGDKLGQLPTRRSSLDGRQVAKFDFAKRAEEDGGVGEGVKEELISPSQVALPVSPA